MFIKFDKEKVFRDSLYGYIKVYYKVISELIDCREVQRLRRIRQLSGVSQVFPTAEHSRFTHSLGTYECARRVIEECRGAKENMSEYEQVLFLCTALLHDLGHGPHSHAFEIVLTKTHEEIGALMIESTKTEVNKVLIKNNINPKDISDILLHKSKYKLIESLTSSQVDVDRMDYLVRDAYFTGASYGTVDRLRILRTMIIKDNQVYFKSSGVNSLENYIMARYHMYWQVYYHKTAQGYELLLQGLYKRIFDLYKNNEDIDCDAKYLIDVMKDSNNIESYLMLDDGYISGLVKCLVKSKDKILNDFANSIEKRKLFKCINVLENKEKAVEIFNKFKKYPKYYFVKAELSQVAYLDNKESLIDVKIIKEDKSIVSLEDYSKIISGLIESGNKKLIRYYYKEPLNV